MDQKKNKNSKPGDQLQEVEATADLPQDKVDISSAGNQMDSKGAKKKQQRQKGKEQPHEIPDDDIDKGLTREFLLMDILDDIEAVGNGDNCVQGRQEAKAPIATDDDFSCDKNEPDTPDVMRPVVYDYSEYGKTELALFYVNETASTEFLSNIKDDHRAIIDINDPLYALAMNGFASQKRAEREKRKKKANSCAVNPPNAQVPTPADGKHETPEIEATDASIAPDREMVCTSDTLSDFAAETAVSQKTEKKKRKATAALLVLQTLKLLRVLLENKRHWPLMSLYCSCKIH